MNYQLIVTKKDKERKRNVLYVGYDSQFALQLVENINKDREYEGFAELEVYRDGIKI